MFLENDALLLRVLGQDYRHDEHGRLEDLNGFKQTRKLQTKISKDGYEQSLIAKAVI